MCIPLLFLLCSMHYFLPKQSCPDAAHKYSDFLPSHTQISNCLLCLLEYRNSSPLYCQWHSHSVWCQPSFCPGYPWSVSCFWHHWPLHSQILLSVWNKKLAFLVWPSAGSSYTCQTGFSLCPQAEVLQALQAWLCGATRVSSRPNSLCAIRKASFEILCKHSCQHQFFSDDT